MTWRSERKFFRRVVEEFSAPHDEGLLRDRDFAAGTIVDTKELVVTGPGGKPSRISTPHGAVIVSQTCDVVLAKCHAVQLARVALLDGSTALEALDRQRPRYVPLPAAGPHLFADLEYVGSVHKDLLANLQGRDGVRGDTQVREFGRDVGRKYSRYAFPDEVEPWLHPLKEVVNEKYDSSDSPTGKVLQDVVELRVEASSGWSAGSPYSLTLIVILSAGALPDFADPPPMPAELAAWFEHKRRTTHEVAERLIQAPTKEDAWHLWHGFGRTLTDRCKPRPTASDEVRSAVAEGELSVEVLGEDEFSLARMRRSEMLDLDHLSDPPPR